MNVRPNMTTAQKAREVAGHLDAFSIPSAALTRAAAMLTEYADLLVHLEQAQPVGEVHRLHYGGRTRNIGFNHAILYNSAAINPGDKLYAALRQQR